MDRSTIILISCALIGSFASLFRRFLGNIDKSTRGRHCWHIIINDYEFNRLATLPLLYFLYTILQGACFGIAVAVLLEGYCVSYMLLPDRYVICQSSHWGILRAFIPILLVVILRISMESYVMVFKIGQLLIDKLQQPVGGTHQEHQNDL